MVQKTETMCYGGCTVPPGTKQRTHVPLGPSGETFPATLINGTAPGRTVLVSSGVHGGEYPGIRAVMELAAALEPADVAGQLILFHPVNVAAFLQRLSYINPAVGENLNRRYPGAPDGSMADRVCDYMVREYLRRVDFVVDLHSGDIHEELLPYVYAPGVGDPAVLEASLACARLVHADYLVRSTGTAGLYNCAACEGTPAILIERGGAGRWNEREVHAYKADICNLLRHWGVLDGAAIEPGRPAPLLTEVHYENAPCDGVFLPQVNLNAPVHAGEVLATISDLFGDVQQTIRAKCDGRVLMLCTSLGVRAGDPIATYGC